MIETWFSPSQIVYNRRQVLWLLRHLPELHRGRWPSNPEGSSYTEVTAVGKRRRAKRKAHFIDSGDILGELMARLAKTGMDGLFVEAVYAWDKSIWALARCANMPLGDVEKRIQRALEYITGWARKQEPYRKEE